MKKRKHPDALIESYLKAIYQLDDPRVHFSIGPADEAVRRALRQLQAHQLTILTAYNPASRPLSLEENRERQERLEQQLQQTGLSWYRGRNLDPAGDWPEELTCIVPNLPISQAVSLARAFGQLAFVQVSPEHVELVVCSPEPP